MRVTNDDYLRQSLSSGSKKRYDSYKERLSQDLEGVIFDAKVLKTLVQYARDPALVEGVRNYLNHLRDRQGRLYSQSFKDHTMIRDALVLFQKPDYTSFRWNRNYQAAVKLLKKQVSEYRLRQVFFGSDEQIREILPKLNTHSGWTYVLSGKRTKGENLDGLYKKFAEERDRAKEVGSFNKPVLIGYRTQGPVPYDNLSGELKEYVSHKTRMVSMYDLILVIAELGFSHPFQDRFGLDPRYMGGKDLNQISSLISDSRARFPFYVSLDYSKFDQSISSWLIEDAFEIIKSAFDPRYFDEDLFEVVVHDFIHKDFIWSEGIVHSDRGVPSGSMFTQLIDSIVNLLMITTFQLSQGCDGSAHIMGDDNLYYYDGTFSKDDICSYLTKNFGILANPSKTSSGSRNDDPEFLSRYWTKVGQWRHPHVLISKLLFPERKRRYDSVSTPELVLYAYFLIYKPAMNQLIDVRRFLSDNPQLNKESILLLDSGSLPGSVAYLRDYTFSHLVA